MCSYFRSVSQPEWLSVDELVDEFLGKARLKITNKIFVMPTLPTPVQQIPLHCVQNDTAHIPHRP